MITEKMRETNLESMYVLNNYSNNTLLDLSDSIIYSIDTIKIYKLICTLVTFTEHILKEKLHILYSDNFFFFKGADQQGNYTLFAKHLYQ